jgi:hypothetical protein
MPEAYKGCSYTFRDDLGGWSEAIASPEKTSKAIGRFLVEYPICKTRFSNDYHN